MDAYVVFDGTGARRRPRRSPRQVASVPCRDVARKLDLAALRAHLDGVRVVVPGAMERACDFVANGRRVDRRHNPELVGDADDTVQHTDVLSGGFLLIVPFDVATEGDPSLFDAHLDSVARNGRVPGETLDRRGRDVLIAAVDVEWEFDLDFLGHRFHAFDPSRRLFGGELLREVLNVAVERHDAIMGGDADMSGIHARFPTEFNNDGLLQLTVV